MHQKGVILGPTSSVPEIYSIAYVENINDIGVLLVRILDVLRVEPHILG